MVYSRIILALCASVVVVTAVSADANLQVLYGPVEMSWTNPCTGGTVSFSGGAMTVGQGKVVPAVQTQSQPWITWDYDSTKLYTLLLQDIEGAFTHFLMANIIPPSVSRATNELFPYFPPLNPTTTAHQYTFMLFEQPGYINISSSLVQKVHDNPLFGRANFDYNGFASTYGLTKIAQVVNHGVVDQWTPFMWKSLLAAPFITSAERSAFSSYYSQACENNFTVPEGYKLGPVDQPLDAGLSVTWGPTNIAFTNPCNNEPHSESAGKCSPSQCEGSQTASQPWITWNANTSKHYTVLMQDMTGGFTHALWVNIIGKSMSFASNEVFPFFPPGNPSTTAHDYTFFLYEQDDWFPVPASILASIEKAPFLSRLNFDYNSIVGGMKMLDSLTNHGYVAPWTPFFYSKFLKSPAVSPTTAAALAPYYKMACANYPTSQ